MDIQRDTYNIDPAAVAAAIGPRTRAVVPVHFAGQACDMAELGEEASRAGLKLVEDAAHALPASYRGTPVGRIGDITCFSFYATKTITTGEGGMITTHDAALAARMRMMSLHGISKDAWKRYTSEGSWYYEILQPGFKYNLTDIASAMGIEQLRKLPRFLERRQKLAARYYEGLAGLPLVLPADAPAGDVHAWHLYVIRLAEGARPGRDAVIEALSQRGIGTSVHYVPLHRQPYWRDRYALTPEMFPVADAAYRSMISIPLFTKMSDADQERVIDALREVLG